MKTCYGKSLTIEISKSEKNDYQEEVPMMGTWSLSIRMEGEGGGDIEGGPCEGSSGK